MALPPRRPGQRDLAFWRLFLPSSKTVHLVLSYAFVLSLSWLFFNYGQGHILRDALLVALGGAGVLGVQKFNRTLPARQEVRDETPVEEL